MIQIPIKLYHFPWLVNIGTRQWWVATFEMAQKMSSHGRNNNRWCQKLHDDLPADVLKRCDYMAWKVPA